MLHNKRGNQAIIIPGIQNKTVKTNKNYCLLNNIVPHHNIMRRDVINYSNQEGKHENIYQEIYFKHQKQ